jgi:hypothetical protein
LLNDEIRGVGKYSVVHKNIELRSSGKSGRGIFATALIPKGSVVWESNEPDQVSMPLPHSTLVLSCSYIDDDGNELHRYLYG